jgi:hypothetical protein
VEITGGRFPERERTRAVYGDFEHPEIEDAVLHISYCLMPNHIHLLTERGQDSLSKILQRVLLPTTSTTIGSITIFKMRMNLRMAPIYAEAVARNLDQNPPPRRQRKFLESGFTKIGDSIVLTAALKLAHVSMSNFPDSTGYEAFVNHWHIDPEGRQSSPAATVGVALSFARALATKLSQAPFSDRVFRIVLSLDDGSSEPVSSTVRFYTVREGEEWLTNDLEIYPEPILTSDQRSGPT